MQTFIYGAVPLENSYIPIIEMVTDSSGVIRHIEILIDLGPYDKPPIKKAPVRLELDLNPANRVGDRRVQRRNVYFNEQSSHTWDLLREDPSYDDLVSALRTVLHALDGAYGKLDSDTKELVSGICSYLRTS